MPYLQKNNWVNGWFDLRITTLVSSKDVKNDFFYYSVKIPGKNEQSNCRYDE